jgi:hypothetical protein
VCGLIGILEPSPPADIENQNLRACDIVKQLLKPGSGFQKHAALSGIDVSPNDYETMAGRICLVCTFLIFDGVLLAAVRHPHILCSRDRVTHGYWNTLLHVAPNHGGTGESTLQHTPAIGLRESLIRARGGCPQPCKRAR